MATVRENGWTNPELRALAEVVAERAESTQAREWQTLAAKLARACQWRGHEMADLGRRLERAAARQPLSV